MLRGYFSRNQESEMEVEEDEESENTMRLIVMFLMNGEKKEVNKKKLSSPDEISKILEDI